MRKGLLIIEVIIAIAVFALFASGAVYFLSASFFSAQAAMQRAVAAAYLQEGAEIVQTIDREAWNYLADSPDDTYGLAEVSGEWSLAADPDHPHGDEDYTRTLTLTDVYRDSTGEIVPSSTSGAVFDPHTRQVTVTIDWAVTVNSTTTMTATSYLTDWDSTTQDDVTDSDWAAGTLSNLRSSTIDDGELQIIQPTLELGTTTATTSWTTVTLTNDYTTPVVVANVLDGNNSDTPVSVRVRNASSNSFEVRLDFPPDNFVPVTTNSETVYYLVIEAGRWYLGDGDTQIEAGIVNDVSTVNCSSCGSWNNGTDVSYQHTYTSNPIVFHQIVTENDADWITSFVSDDTSSTNPPGTDGFQVALNGAEVTTSHAAEDIAYVVFEREVIDSFEHISFETDATGQVIGGYETTHYSETFDQTYTSVPWVLATNLTARGTDGSWMMLDAATTTSITLYLDEDQTLDQERFHSTEYGGYIAFAQPTTYYLNDATPVYDEPPLEVGVITASTTATMEVGTITASTSWSTVTLSNSYSEPVVIATVLDGNNSNTPLSARVRNAASNSFEVRLDIPTDNFVPVTSNSETVYYLVVEAGTWIVGDGKTKIEANIIEDVARVNCRSCGSWNNGTDVSYRNAYSAEPVVLHQVMSENDSSWITSFVSDDTSSTNPPGTDGFQIALNGAEVTSTHAAEDIGYIVVSTDAVDTSSSITFETDKTGDVVRGYSNTHTTESFTTTYSSAPLVVASQMGMDGVEGSWAMIDSLSATQITVYVDEDQTLDSERSHQTEDYAYVAFSDSGTLTLTNQTFLENPVTVTLQNSYTEPVVITTPHFTNDLQSPASIRVYDVTSNSFTAKLDAPTDNFPAVNTTFSDDVYYLVIEAGQWQIGDMLIEADVAEVSTVGSSSGGYSGTVINFNHRYTADPVVLHQVMSLNDSAWITSFVTQNGNIYYPPTTTDMSLGLNAAQVTPSVSHAAEDIGYVVFSNVGVTEASGVELHTVLEDELATGHDQGCVTVTPGGSYTSPIVFAAQMTMDGSDGSWATVCSIDDTTVGVHVEEDTYTDSERSHDAEALGMLIFEEAFTTPGTVNTSNYTTGTYESVVFGDGSSERNWNIIEWSEYTDCPRCDVLVQVRTADSITALATASYLGPDGTSATTFADPVGDLLTTSSIGQAYVQYFVTLEGTTAESPILEDVTLTYYEN